MAAGQGCVRVDIVAKDYVSQSDRQVCALRQAKLI